MDTTFYFYNPEGVLESELIGTRFTDYLYLENRPLAMARSTGELWYLHTDHLGSVRAATDRQRQIIWRWESDAFGNGRANDNPNGGRIRTEINLRFPGQYYDSESGLHYNYYRYYDPTLGRYTRVDPIGLKGGMNPYLYVNANPLQLADPLGLEAFYESLPGQTGTKVDFGNPGVIAGPDGEIYIGAELNTISCIVNCDDGRDSIKIDFQIDSYGEDTDKILEFIEEIKLIPASSYCPGELDYLDSGGEIIIHE